MTIWQQNPVPTLAAALGKQAIPESAPADQHVAYCINRLRESTAAIEHLVRQLSATADRLIGEQTQVSDSVPTPPAPMTAGGEIGDLQTQITNLEWLGKHLAHVVGRLSNL